MFGYQSIALVKITCIIIVISFFFTFNFFLIFLCDRLLVVKTFHNYIICPVSVDNNLRYWFTKGNHIFELTFDHWICQSHHQRNGGHDSIKIFFRNLFNICQNTKANAFLMKPCKDKKSVCTSQNLKGLHPPTLLTNFIWGIVSSIHREL